MKPVVILYIFGIAVFLTIAAVAPFARKRVRAPWAKAVFVILGLAGATDAFLGLLREMHWFSLGFPIMDLLLLSLDIFVLGLFVLLAVTRQLFGKKRTENAPST